MCIAGIVSRCLAAVRPQFGDVTPKVLAFLFCNLSSTFLGFVLVFVLVADVIFKLLMYRNRQKYGVQANCNATELLWL